MTRDFVHINDFVVLLEEAQPSAAEVDVCRFEDSIIAVAFYGSGDVELNVKYGDKKKNFKHTRGLALSFYANDRVEFEHLIAAHKKLECIVVATSIRNLDKLPFQEGEIFREMLKELVNPSDHYVEGPKFFMSPEMESIVNSIFSNSYTGKTKMMFFRSHITSLLSHFFGQLAIQEEHPSKPQLNDELNQVKELLLSNLDDPPSLKELSQHIGLNTTKLKKEFKEVFGIPIFKYLQNERLSTAHKLISEKQSTVQEAAWQVGYDSLSSFSNAFSKKFGYRPSQIK